MPKNRWKKVIMPWAANYEMVSPDLQHRIVFIYLVYPEGAKVENLTVSKVKSAG